VPPADPASIQIGSETYARHLEEEIRHYTDVFTTVSAADPAAGTGYQPVPDVWRTLEKRAEKLIRDLTGNNVVAHVISRLDRTRPVDLLSLGAGACGIEISFARRIHSARITCVDVNSTLLEQARAKASAEGREMRFETADLNTIELPAAAYDVVFCHAALHHVIQLEHLFEQIRRTLRPGGELIVVDVITPNGYRMRPATRAIVNTLWPAIPPRFRINHTAYSEPRLDLDVWEADTSAMSMECIRSQDILPLLQVNFETRHFVPYYSISRRFFDTMYGPNYELTNRLDRTIFEFIWELDQHYIGTGELEPETFFGMYVPGS
jgi:SAM-dependent methyltransferase